MHLGHVIVCGFKMASNNSEEGGFPGEDGPDYGSHDTTSGDAGCGAYPRITQPRDWRLFNVIVLGVAFLLMFTSFQTCSMIEVSSMSNEHPDSCSTFCAA